uniref:Uncharacterized protein n=1 Tax=Tanacetum cinerariifolium TaxID=118510 RepID=A0A699R3L0_TANCI|nr:hypothetical protein [Tanacetum cinerariifolium]
MRLFERGFCCLRLILLVGMVSAGRHSFLLVAVVSIHFCWSCDSLLVVPHSCCGLTSTGILLAAGPTISAERSSPIRDPTKGKAVATPSSHVTAPTDKELADQQAAILEAER